MRPEPRGERWTEGVCGDGAAILLDGQPVAISDLLEILNSFTRLCERARYEGTPPPSKGQ